MAAKKSETDAAPAKQGRLRQYWAVFSMTRRHDPALVWWMLLSLLGTVAVSLVLGIVLGHPIYLSTFGVMFGATLALYVLTRRAETAAFAQLLGQPGASVAALQNLRKGWTVEDQPSAVDPRTQDLVFRAIGRPGVVLITEGPLPRVNRLAEQERKRITRVLGASKMDECGFPTKSTETRGSSMYSRIPLRGPPAAFSIAALIAAASVVDPSWTLRSTTETSAVGTRMA